MSRRVKVNRTGSRRVDISARVLEEYREVQRRRDQWATQQATREQVADLAKRQGWQLQEDR